MSTRVFQQFETTVPGKWVLAGEHAVLKGYTSVALPHPTFLLKLKHRASNEKLRVDPPELSLLIEELIDRFCSLVSVGLAQKQDLMTGHLEFQSSIPLGAGLGSSAAICVGLSRWLAHELKISNDKIREIATSLEDRFHGKSSGMDVAVESLEKPISFSIQGGPQVISIERMPRFQFHDTGLRAGTKECVLKVQKYREENKTQGERADLRMGEAAQLAIEALKSGNIAQIREVMNISHDCFEEWGLVPDEVRRQREHLLKQGAMAVKLTGAGGGGFLVSLWG